MKMQMSLNNKETLKSDKNVEYAELNDYSESVLDLQDIKFGIHLDKDSKQLSVAIFNRLNGKLTRHDISYTNLKSFKNGLKILCSKQYYFKLSFCFDDIIENIIFSKESEELYSFSFNGSNYNISKIQLKIFIKYLKIMIKNYKYL